MSKTLVGRMPAFNKTLIGFPPDDPSPDNEILFFSIEPGTIAVWRTREAVAKNHRYQPPRNENNCCDCDQPLSLEQTCYQGATGMRCRSCQMKEAS